MSRIKIKNFGPIRGGTDDEWLEVKKVTAFIGNQGSGKSTVAKLISTMCWLEKALVMGTIGPDDLSHRSQFLKHLAYQRLEHYERDETEIAYEGKAYCLHYKNGRLVVHKSPDNGYLLPKIMYAPAERNFLSAVDRPDKLRNLPSALYTFNDEFDAAKAKFAGGVALPINNARFEYDKLNRLARIVGDGQGYSLRLSEASSGFQSTVPLYLVTKHLSEGLSGNEQPGIRENSLEDQKKLEREIKAIMGDPELSPEVRQAFLRALSSQRKRSCLLNIVEEPEQNLFPSSQRDLLFELLGHTRREGNKLVLTTHSPYLISCLSISIQASYLSRRIQAAGRLELLEKLHAVVPELAQVSGGDVAVYEMDEILGKITLLPSPLGIPSDRNFLNDWLRQGNEAFDRLLELEEDL